MYHHRENPTYKHGLRDEKRLDFSIEILEHIDAYLDALHGEPPRDEGDTMRVDRVAFREAERYSALAKGLGYSVAAAGILMERLLESVPPAREGLQVRRKRQRTQPRTANPA